MAREPSNPKLWELVGIQARAKFHPFPSIAASGWMHKSYVDKGGQFVDTAKDKREKTGRRR